MILITEFMDHLAVKKLQERYVVTYDPSLVENQNAIIKLIGDVRAIIVRNRTLVTKELIQNAPNLSCVGRLGVGLDNIDLLACQKRNISVYPANGANTNSVAEYVICTAMILLRGAFFNKKEMLSGLWPREKSSGLELKGKIMGLIGFGETAQCTKVIVKEVP